ncbi:unnamed protein product [Enterobius vermicularis]|uniref:Protein MIS12 homolog n=1 Tax=Enterobius vermicularis TaxID=51028 RepID=A0A0N4V7U7_ENTVE|nr:unnamed protein product [Enterobius vermicularis]
MEVGNDLYEYETQFFGFSPKGFIDTVYNVIVETWTTIVQKEIIPKIKCEDIDDSKISNLKKKFASLIVRNNFLDGMMDRLEQHVVHYIFRIPDFLTLPEDLPNLEVNETIDEEVEIGQRIKRLEDEIVEYKCNICFEMCLICAYLNGILCVYSLVVAENEEDYLQIMMSKEETIFTSSRSSCKICMLLQLCNAVEPSSAGEADRVVFEQEKLRSSHDRKVKWGE